jgi:hypothetical protein
MSSSATERETEIQVKDPTWLGYGRSQPKRQLLGDWNYPVCIIH